MAVHLVHYGLAEFIAIFRQPISSVCADLMGANVDNVEEVIHAIRYNRIKTDSFKSPFVFASTFAGRSNRGRTIADRIPHVDTLCGQLGNTSQGVIHWGYTRQNKRGMLMMFNIHLVNCDEESVIFRPRHVRREAMYNGVLCHKVKWYGFPHAKDDTYEPIGFLD
jgi:hypothetical protein